MVVFLPWSRRRATAWQSVAAGAA